MTPWLDDGDLREEYLRIAADRLKQLSLLTGEAA